MPFPQACWNKAAAITPSDATNIPEGVTQAVYVGGAGNVVVVFQDGSTATFSGVAAGSTLWVQAKRINSTNTTATLMLALYQV